MLVGTLDVEESEELPERLVKAGVPAVVLNAKNDAEEAAIIAEAGELGAVTVSTQMAGRGVDIRLGGSDEADHEQVAELGGLYVIGSGRHDSRRLDDQLRGRAGRQGDPGGSVFFVSLEDDLVVPHLEPDKLPAATATRTAAIAEPESGEPARARPAVAEGRHHEIHRNTWRYSVLIEQQRASWPSAARLLRTATAARSWPSCARTATRSSTSDSVTKLTRSWSGSAGRSRCTTWTGAGPSTWRSCPRSARACTCGRWAGRTRSTSSTGWPSRVRLAGRRPIEAAQQTFETADVIEDEPGSTCEAGAADATWTYMVHDNPLADDTMSALSLPGVFR